MLDVHALGHALEEARHQRDRDTELLAALDLPQEHLVRRGREGHDHVLDPVLLDQPLEIPAGPEHGHGQARLVERLLVEEADRLEPELRVVEQPSGGERADAAGTHDQGRPGQLAVPPGHQLRPVEGHAARGEVHGAEGQQPQRLAGEVVHVPRQKDPEGEQRHRCEHHGGDDALEVVQHRQAQPPVVEATAREQADDQCRVREQPDRLCLGNARAPGGQLGDERRREQHQAVEEERSPRPGAEASSAPRRDGAFERKGLERGKRFSVQGSRGHAAARSRRLLRLPVVTAAASGRACAGSCRRR